MRKEHNSKFSEARLNPRELDNKACPFCGSRKYQLVLRWDMQAQVDGLIARCAQCQRPR